MATFTLQQLKDILASHKDNPDINDATISFTTTGDYDEAGRYVTTLIPVYNNITSLAVCKTIALTNHSTSGMACNLTDEFRATFQTTVDDRARFIDMFGESRDIIQDDLAPLSDRPSLSCRFNMLIHAPYERVENGNTYRIIMNGYRHHNQVNVLMCHTSDEPQYNYMDQGMHIFSYRPKNTQKIKNIFFKQPSITFYKITCILPFLPADAADLFQDGCYFNPKQEKLLLMGLEKRLGQIAPEQMRLNNQVATYASYVTALQRRWLASAENRLTQEFIAGKRDTLEKNGVLYKKNEVSYEGLSIRCEDMRDIFNTGFFNWASEYDIYGLLSVVANWAQYKANTTPYTVTVNGMPIPITITTYNRTQVLGHAINKDEVSAVLQRALCFKELDKYTDLVKSVSKMSLLVHDALANGIALRWRKLPENTADSGRSFFQRDKQDGFKNNPRLKFVRENNKFYVLAGEEQTTKVHIPYFVGFVRRLQRINNRIDGHYYYRDGRNYASAEHLIIAELVRSTKGKPMQVVDGETGLTTEVQRPGQLTEQQARELLYAVDTVTVKAIAKAELFLANIVAKVGAVKTTRGGIEGYTVQGKKTTYFVETATNKVCHNETGAYICIVDNDHGIRLGCDELATRLMALKNDERSVAKITTLAQYVN